jgi:hypothetical protein
LIRPEERTDIEYYRLKFSSAPLAASLAFALLSGAGCSVDSQLDIDTPGHKEAAKHVVLRGETDPTAAALYHGELSLKVGDSISKALQTFPEPTRGAYEIHDLPSQFDDSFLAKGWETSTGEGFGAVSQEGKVVGAIYELQNERSTSVDDFVRDELQGMAPTQPKMIEGGGATYRFWHVKTQTVMICLMKTNQGEDLTLAMGDDNILAQFAISEKDAIQQIAELKRAISQSSPAKS